MNLCPFSLCTIWMWKMPQIQCENMLKRPRCVATMKWKIIVFTSIITQHKKASNHHANLPLEM